MNKTPFVSIIIPTKDHPETLVKTVESISIQTYTSREIIVIDGGKSGEPDRGVYDAMNKGIERSRGEWLLFLGDDDVLADEKVLEKVFQNYFSGYYLLYGDVMYDSKKIYRSSFGNILFFRNSIHHQGAFYNRKCFEHFRYDPDNKILGDYDLNMFIHRNFFSVKKLPYVIANCGIGGLSKKYVKSLYKEEIIIKKKYIGVWFMPFMKIWVWMKFLYKR